MRVEYSLIFVHADCVKNKRVTYSLKLQKYWCSLVRVNLSYPQVSSLSLVRAKGNKACGVCS